MLSFKIDSLREDRMSQSIWSAAPPVQVRANDRPVSMLGWSMAVLVGLALWVLLSLLVS